QAAARTSHRVPGRLPARPAGGARGSRGAMSETTVALDAEFLAGRRFPYQEDIALVDDVDLLAATPGEDLNWLEDVELLEEDGVARGLGAPGALGGNDGPPGRLQVRRRRCGHPRPLDRLPPRGGASEPRPRLRPRRGRAREARARRRSVGDRVRRRPQQLLPARDERAD